ncbi:hypothetical protein BEN47_15915 [Hymenobacter lapidarius]|uniref:Peptidase M50 domain-containing protein n=1 Tax=Hymenobacter lapidarius TaxID=1908237 RepID=A0A1G1T1M3_9BACT|nr:M50 family metallopeptidase [Hymenobacter lapidarius]OGX84747.1 hypothetical protein BEN47_15915 [Hymenobacter lapidarius]
MKKSKKLLTFLISILVGGGLGLLVGKYVGAYFKHAHWGGGQVAALLSLLPLAWLVAVGLHELGHALAGGRQGFVLQWFVVGPLMWKQQDGRLRFRWNTNLNTAGGMVLCVPPDDHNLRRRFMIFAAGGPLGSVVWAALALGIWALLPTPATVVGQVLAAGLAGSGGFSVFLALLTAVPFHTGGFSSDGARVLNLWRGGPAGQLEMAVLSAFVRSASGVRPRELPLAELEEAVASPAELPFKLYAYQYLYLAALDAGQIDQAGQYLREYRDRLALTPPALQANGWLESAFFAAAYEHDLPAARAFREKAQVTAHTPTDVLPRTEAALARLAGDADAARAQAQTALRELPKTLDPGSARLYTEWLADTVCWATEPATARIAG